MASIVGQRNTFFKWSSWLLNLTSIKFPNTTFFRLWKVNMEAILITTEPSIQNVFWISSLMVLTLTQESHKKHSTQVSWIYLFVPSPYVSFLSSKRHQPLGLYFRIIPFFGTMRFLIIEPHPIALNTKILVFSCCIYLRFNFVSCHKCYYDKTTSYR